MNTILQYFPTNLHDEQTLHDSMVTLGYGNEISIAFWSLLYKIQAQTLKIEYFRHTVATTDTYHHKM